MNQTASNIFALIPDDTSNEVFENIVSADNVRIERIISKGHISPHDGWYDQDEHEWVMVLQGAARIEFAEQAPVHLVSGVHLHIPAHTRHKVAWTDPTTETIWLAVYYT